VAAGFVKEKKKGGGAMKAVLFVLVFAVCAAGGFFGFQKIR
jgi:hypothetical protein